MITPSFGLTATERVLPKLALDFTTASLDSRITFTRSGNTATVVNSSGVVATINANLPRFDYSPTTLICKGLLIEESRTNLCLYSENISQAPWAFTRAGYVLDATTSPANTSTADKLYESTAASNTHYVNTTFAGTSGTAYTASIFLKAGERTQFRLRFTGTASFADVYFDLSAGTIFNTVSGSGTITSYGNGWYRCTITGTSDLTGTCSFINYLCLGGTSIYTGDGSSGAYLWGGQIEAGAFATSYIPTTTSQVTRTADVATMTGTNFSDWYNASEGMFVATVIPSVTATTTMGVLSTSDGTNTKTMDIRFQGGKAYGASVDTTTQALIDLGSFLQDVASTISFTYKANSYAAAKNGVASGVDNSGTVPSQNTMRIGNLTATLPYYGKQHIQRIMYYPQRCTNAEVQAFSK